MYVTRKQFEARLRARLEQQKAHAERIVTLKEKKFRAPAEKKSPITAPAPNPFVKKALETPMKADNAPLWFELLDTL